MIPAQGPPRGGRPPRAGTVSGMTIQDSAGGHLAPGVRAVLAGRPALLEDACQRALAYLGTLAERRVAPAADAVAALSRLDFALPGPGLEAPDVLSMLDDFGSPATVASGGPRYFGFVTGGALPVAQAAAWLSVAWDQNAALKAMSPTAALLDAVEEDGKHEPDQEVTPNHRRRNDLGQIENAANDGA